MNIKITYVTRVTPNNRAVRHLREREIAQSVTRAVTAWLYSR